MSQYLTKQTVTKIDRQKSLSLTLSPTKKGVS